MKVDLAVFDGMDELDAVGPLEVLRTAAQWGADFDVKLVAPEPGGSVTCAHGLTISADGTPRPDADLIVFPGGGWIARSEKGARAEVESGRWEPLIRSAESRRAVLASVCTGAMILAKAGALRGRRATTHHNAWADLEAAGAILVRERVVDDGDRITAGGVTSGIDLGLWLVERFANQQLASKIATNLEYRAPEHAC